MKKGFDVSNVDLSPCLRSTGIKYIYKRISMNLRKVCRILKTN